MDRGFRHICKALPIPGTTVDLARGISIRGQKDFDKLYPRPEFDNAIAALKEDLANLKDSLIVVRLMRIVAGAHNSIKIP